MFDKVEIGRVWGIPVAVDMSLILIVVLWGQGYFTSGDAAAMSYGALLIAGLLLSILLHEFGHAAALLHYRIPVSHIELNGMGGLCYPARPVPPDRLPNIVVLLAGPAVTCALWLLFSGLETLLGSFPAQAGPFAGLDRLSGLCWHLGEINWWLLLFNLAPSHPLDGGRALAHILSRWLGYDRAMRFVACTGLLVIVWLVWEGVQGSYFAFLLAFFLFQANQQVLVAHAGRRWQRWN